MTNDDVCTMIMTEEMYDENEGRVFKGLTY